jgi:hypothetical protein
MDFTRFSCKADECGLWQKYRTFSLTVNRRCHPVAEPVRVPARTAFAALNSHEFGYRSENNPGWRQFTAFGCEKESQSNYPNSAAVGTEGSIH